MRIKLNTEQYIAKADNIHNKKYIYIKTTFTKMHGDIIVTCPIHGDFKIKAYSHLEGKGCKLCAIEQNAAKRRQTTEDFINKSKEIFGEGTYIYTKTKCGKNNKEEVIITCPIHGDFKIKPNNHISNKIGCKLCSNEQKSLKMSTPFNLFEEKANEIHNKKYKYISSDYKNIKTPTSIICPIHGLFKQYPQHHLRGAGCHKCNQSQLERIIEKLLIENNIDYAYQYKAKWLGKLSLDFYLPKHNIAIECQGIQHFESINFFGGEKKFEELINRDKLKKELCSKNKINLIYFSNIIKYNSFLNETLYHNTDDLLKFII